MRCACEECRYVVECAYGEVVIRMVYMITYDLNAEGQKYDDVIAAIKSASDGVWCSYWKSSWLIRSNLSTASVFEKIKPYLDGNDRLLVIEVKSNWRGWLTEHERNYINSQIFQGT